MSLGVYISGKDLEQLGKPCLSWRLNMKYIATDKALFASEKMLISFLFLYKNIRCGYSLEVPRRGTSNEYPQHMFL